MPTEEEIQKRFAELPPDVQRAIQSNDVGMHLQEVATKYSLHIDQMGGLKGAVYMVMLGFADPATFTDDVAELVRVSHEVAEKIATDLSEALFMPIRQSMQKFMEEPDQKESASNTAVMPAALPPITPADHMLTASVIAPQQTVDVTPAVTSSTTKKYPVDPYREPAE